MIELSCDYLPVRCIWLYVLTISSTCFTVNRNSNICLNIKELIARNRCNICSLSDCNRTRTNNHLFRKRNTQPFGHCDQIDWRELWLLICTVQLTVCSSHVNYAFQSESALYICLSIRELLARNMCHIWRLSDCSRIPTNNNFVGKQTLNHFTKLTQLIELSCDYLYLRWGWLYDFIMSGTH